MGQPPVAVATHRRFTAAPPNIQALHRRCIHSSRASSYLAHRPVDDALRCSYALEHRTRRRSRIGCKGDGESVESVSKCEARSETTDAIFTFFFFPRRLLPYICPVYSKARLWWYARVAARTVRAG